MQDNRAEQIEALGVAKDYCVKLQNGINNVVKELREGRLPDTTEYLNTILKGINWVFEVYNGTKEVIAESGVVIDKEKVNSEAARLSKSLKDKDDLAVADILENVIAPFLAGIQKAAEAVK